MNKRITVWYVKPKCKTWKSPNKRVNKALEEAGALKTNYEYYHVFSDKRPKIYGCIVRFGGQI